jgi:hypothetical protein
MLRSKISLAILLSLVLILIASWHRFYLAPTSDEDLIVINSENKMSEDFLLDILNTAETKNFATPPTPERLSKTDILARNLFTDYAESNHKGLDSSADLEKIADKYSDLILEESQVGYTPVSISELSVVSDGVESLNIYGKKMLNLRKEGIQEMESASSRSSMNQVGEQDYQEFFTKAAQLYNASAEEMVGIKVPKSLAGNHLRIINIYLQNAVALASLSKINDDPFAAIGAAKTQSVNSQIETELFLNIELALMAVGLSPQNI